MEHFFVSFNKELATSINDNGQRDEKDTKGRRIDGEASLSNEDDEGEAFVSHKRVRRKSLHSCLISRLDEIRRRQENSLSLIANRKTEVSRRRKSDMKR